MFKIVKPQKLSVVKVSSIVLDDRTPSPQKCLNASAGDIDIPGSKDAAPDTWSTEEGNLNPPSSASSGFSDDDSLHGDGAALTMVQLVDFVRHRSR